MSVRLLFVAGGTGGHLFPALAVADACKKLESDVEIEFIGSRGKMEETVVPRAGYKLNLLWLSGIGRLASLKTLGLPVKVSASLARALGIIRRFRPNVVICAGAYVRYPVGVA